MERKYRKCSLCETRVFAEACKDLATILDVPHSLTTFHFNQDLSHCGTVVIWDVNINEMQRAEGEIAVGRLQAVEVHAPLDLIYKLYTSKPYL